MNESILDDNLDEDLEVQENSSYFLSILLVCHAVLIWMPLKNAGELPYDANYANIMVAFITSFSACICILYYYLKIHKAFVQNIFTTIIFLLSSSPISIFYACTQYKEIFGVSLAN